jgi:hypothetical protein
MDMDTETGRAWKRAWIRAIYDYIGMDMDMDKGMNMDVAKCMEMDKDNGHAYINM